jgi:hypothetical protein
MRSVALLILSLPSIARGHSSLNYPPTIGFDDDKEGEGPCGGFSVAFNNMAAFYKVHIRKRLSHSEQHLAVKRHSIGQTCSQW